MKKLVLILFSFVLFSCNNSKSNEKSIYDLERESLESGVYNDTIFGKLQFGSTESEIFVALNCYHFYDYRFDVDEIRYINWNIEPAYLNDSLYSIGFRNMDAAYKFSTVVNLYNTKYGQYDYFDKSDVMTEHYYWFQNNLKIEIYKLEFEYGSQMVIKYTDLIKQNFIFENHSKLKQESNNYSDYWTKKYYNDIYLPKKKEKLGGI
ncbi:MAG: hypothetical protein LBN95_02765 [Prevotellaceae bacterium]|jgi:hypothetical protein|nr:hypothetical protein [Prevotellaceae bacterium]